MRVLHIWNTAGVASVIAKYQSKILGWDTWVITRKKYDPYGFTVYGEAVSGSLPVFILKAVRLASKYDVLHIHDLDVVVPLLRLLYGNRKKIVLHYHGSSIRGKWREKSKYWSRADAVIVATKDLLEGAPRGVQYLPNPVDTELFKPMPGIEREEGSAVFIYYSFLKGDISWARNVAEKMGLKLTLHDRDSSPVRYVEMPVFLNRFEFLIDRRRIRSLSKTALEALACGLKVVRWDERVVEGLPGEHEPENVVRRLAEVYG